MRFVNRVLVNTFAALSLSVTGYAQGQTPAPNEITQNELKAEAYGRVIKHFRAALILGAGGVIGIRGTPAITKTLGPKTAALFATASTVGLAVSVNQGIAGVGVLAMINEGNYKGAISYSDEVGAALSLVQNALTNTGTSALVWGSAAGYSNTQVMNAVTITGNLEQMAINVSELGLALDGLTKATSFSEKLAGTTEITALLLQLNESGEALDKIVTEQMKRWEEERRQQELRINERLEKEPLVPPIQENEWEDFMIDPEIQEWRDQQRRRPVQPGNGGGIDCPSCQPVVMKQLDDFRMNIPGKIIITPIAIIPVINQRDCPPCPIPIQTPMT